jgi:hypothetical protein
MRTELRGHSELVDGSLASSLCGCNNDGSLNRLRGDIGAVMAAAQEDLIDSVVGVVASFLGVGPERPRIKRARKADTGEPSGPDGRRARRVLRGRLRLLLFSNRIAGHQGSWVVLGRNHDRHNRAFVPLKRRQVGECAGGSGSTPLTGSSTKPATCVSGSPKRALNSITRVPREVSQADVRANRRTVSAPGHLIHGWLSNCRDFFNGCRSGQRRIRAHSAGIWSVIVAV